jgi:hypothetical protein
MKLALGRRRNGVVDVIKLGDGEGKDNAGGQYVSRLQSMYYYYIPGRSE